MRRALPALFALALLVGTAPAPLLAHGRLKSSVPSAGAHLAQAPGQLRLDFSESAELAFTTIRLLDANGRDVALSALTFAPDSRRAVIARITGGLAAGTYAVVWQVAGDDGHPVRGRYEFVIAPGAMGTATSPGTMPGMHHDPVTMPDGEGFGAESPLYVVVRWLAFGALLLVIGAVSFRTFVLGALHRNPSSDLADAAPFISGAGRAAARVGYLATFVLGLTLLLRLFAQSFAMHGARGVLDVRSAGSMIANTTWGWGWLLQLAGVVLAGIGFHRARSVVPEARSAARWWMVAALGALAAAFSPALSGHAASAPQYRALVMFADWLHVLGASSWLGSLAVMLIAGLGSASLVPDGVRARLIRALVNAFSPVALASAGLAVTTGAFAAWVHVGTITSLWSTRYGITLLVKLAILGIVGLTGFYNWKFVQPRLGTDEATSRLHRSASVEVAVAVIVLLVTAVLVASPTAMDMRM